MLKITPQLLSSLIGLSEGITIVDAWLGSPDMYSTMDFDDSEVVVSILLHHRFFEKVPEGCEAPTADTDVFMQSEKL